MQFFVLNSKPLVDSESLLGEGGDEMEEEREEKMERLENESKLCVQEALKTAHDLTSKLNTLHQEVIESVQLSSSNKTVHRSGQQRTLTLILVLALSLPNLKLYITP